LDIKIIAVLLQSILRNEIKNMIQSSIINLIIVRLHVVNIILKV